LLLHVADIFGLVNVLNFFYLKPSTHIINAAGKLKSSYLAKL